MACPTCGKRTGKLIIWSAVLFFITVFYAVKLLSPIVKSSSRSEDNTLVRRHIPLTDPGQIVKASHPDWDNTDCNLVAEKKIRLFMSKPKVLEAWGSPTRVITTHDSVDFKKETWILPGDRKVTFSLIGLVESFEAPE